MTKQEKTWVWISGVLALFVVIGLIAAIGHANPPTNTVAVSAQTSPAEATTSAAASPTTAPTTRVAISTPAPVTTQAPAPPPTTHEAAAAPTTEAPAAPTTQAADTCGAPANPDGYTYCGGPKIYSPNSNVCQYFNCIDNFSNGKGYMEECKDGMVSMSGGRSGACSYHGGEERPVYSA